MDDTQELLRQLAALSEDPSAEGKYLSVQDLVRLIAKCVRADDEGLYLEVKQSDEVTTRQAEQLPEPEPQKEIYQMVERQIWNDHGNIWAQNVTKDDRVPDEYSHFSDYLALPLTENKNGVIYDYLIRYDDNVLYYDPANSGKNVDSECRIFKDRQEFLDSDADHGAIYLKVSIFDEPGFLAKWYVTKDHWVALETEQYDVLRTYTKVS